MFVIDFLDDQIRKSVVIKIRGVEGCDGSEFPERCRNVDWRSQGNRTGIQQDLYACGIPHNDILPSVSVEIAQCNRPAACGISLLKSAGDQNDHRVWRQYESRPAIQVSHRHLRNRLRNGIARSCIEIECPVAIPVEHAHLSFDEIPKRSAEPHGNVWLAVQVEVGNCGHTAQVRNHKRLAEFTLAIAGKNLCSVESISDNSVEVSV